MENTVTIQTEQGDVVVKKLALAEYAELIRALRKLPGELAQLFQSGKDVSEMSVLFAELPEIVADSFPDFVAILAAGCDKDEEFINKLDLADALEIIEAILTINNYQKIVATVKKIMARGQDQNKTAKPNAKPASNNQ